MTRRIELMTGVPIVIALYLALVSSAMADPCDGEEGAAFGLCASYCIHMECGTQQQSASNGACDRVKGSFQKVTGRTPSCSTAWLKCTLTSGVIYCEAGGLTANALYGLERDEVTCDAGTWALTGGWSYKYADENGHITFDGVPLNAGPPDYMYTLLTPCNNGSIVLALNNQPGETLARFTLVY